MHDHTSRADRAEQCEAGRDDPAQPLIVEPDKEFEHDGTIELAFAGGARTEGHREFFHPERCFDSGEDIEQDLEADAREAVRVAPHGLGAEHEKAAHRIGQSDAGDLAGETVRESGRPLAVRPVPCFHAGTFGEA